jgi:hypothetical protein
MTNLLELISKKTVRGTVCGLVVIASMLVVNVPKAHAFLRCFTMTCTDDLSVCKSVEVPCPPKPAPNQ